MIGRFLKWLCRPFADAFADALVTAFMAHERRRHDFVEARMCAEFRILAKKVRDFQQQFNQRGGTPEELQDFSDTIPQWMLSVALGADYPEARRVFDSEFQLEEVRSGNGR